MKRTAHSLSNPAIVNNTTVEKLHLSLLQTTQQVPHSLYPPRPVKQTTHFRPCRVTVNETQGKIEGQFQLRLKITQQVLNKYYTAHVPRARRHQLYTFFPGPATTHISKVERPPNTKAKRSQEQTAIGNEESMEIIEESHWPSESKTQWKMAKTANPLPDRHRQRQRDQHRPFPIELLQQPQLHEHHPLSHGQKPQQQKKQKQAQPRPLPQPPQPQLPAQEQKQPQQRESRMQKPLQLQPVMLEPGQQQTMQSQGRQQQV